MASKLAEKNLELETKQKKLRTVLDEAKTGRKDEHGADIYDFSKVKSLDGDSTEAKVEQFQALHDELTTLANEATQLAIAEKAENIKAIGERMKRPVGERLEPAARQTKSLGQLFIESEPYQNFLKSKGRGDAAKFAIQFPDLELKTLFETGNGWAVPSLPSYLVEAATRPIQVLDLVPVFPMTGASVSYWEEGTRTHNAAEVREGEEYSEDGYALVERTSPARKIGTSLPVTDEQLEDRGQVMGYLDTRLRFSCRQKLDGQIILGSGTAPALRGILNVAGIGSQAKSTDPTFDAVHKAMTQVRVTGRANPNAVVMHPNDWEAIRLTRTADGIYIMGNPADPGVTRLFGLPVAVADVITENTALVGDFANFCRLHDRRGVEVQIGYVDDQFKKGRQTLRADVRVAFTVERPAAFCKVTGI